MTCFGECPTCGIDSLAATWNHFHMAMTIGAVGLGVTAGLRTVPRPTVQSCVLIVYAAVLLFYSVAIHPQSKDGPTPSTQVMGTSAMPLGGGVSRVDSAVVRMPTVSASVVHSVLTGGMLFIAACLAVSLLRVGGNQLSSYWRVPAPHVEEDDRTGSAVAQLNANISTDTPNVNLTTNGDEKTQDDEEAIESQKQRITRYDDLPVDAKALLKIIAKRMEGLCEAKKSKNFHAPGIFFHKFVYMLLEKSEIDCQKFFTGRKVQGGVAIGVDMFRKCTLETQNKKVMRRLLVPRTISIFEALARECNIDLHYLIQEFVESAQAFDRNGSQTFNGQRSVEHYFFFDEATLVERVWKDYWPQYRNSG